MFSRSLALLSWGLHLAPNVCAGHGTVRAALASWYSNPYTLGTSHEFDPKDGWQTVNVTNTLIQTIEPYHSAFRDTDTVTMPDLGVLERRRTRKITGTPNKSLTSKQPLAAVGETIKFLGSVIDVVITWYSGNDLLNPSCWSQAVWTPTDESFVCAVTLDGWTTRPKCFDFLQLCTSKTTCITVRVVDTCAGCKSGSKHVDLTQAAFRKLASLDVGILSVQMRHVSTPTEWFEELWGPKT